MSKSDEITILWKRAQHGYERAFISDAQHGRFELIVTPVDQFNLHGWKVLKGYTCLAWGKTTLYQDARRQAEEALKGHIAHIEEAC